MLSSLWFWLKENARLAAAGGRWTKAVSPDTQKNLRWFFLDGVMSAGLDGIVGPFFSLYMLALGASSSLIVAQWGYYPIFMLCGIGRLIGIFYFWQFVHAKAEPHQ